MTTHKKNFLHHITVLIDIQCIYLTGVIVEVIKKGRVVRVHRVVGTTDLIRVGLWTQSSALMSMCIEESMTL